ncbi:MAG TPA: hypothetical protein VGN22_08350 [Pseudonocardia sp.]
MARRSAAPTTGDRCHLGGRVREQRHDPFGLTRLADLMDDLRCAREVLARDEVARLRLTTMTRLQAEIRSRLEQVGVGLSAALSRQDGALMRASLLQAGLQVRQASAAARHLSYGFRRTAPSTGSRRAPRSHRVRPGRSRPP